MLIYHRCHVTNGSLARSWNFEVVDDTNLNKEQLMIMSCFGSGLALGGNIGFLIRRCGYGIIPKPMGAGHGEANNESPDRNLSPMAFGRDLNVVV